MQIMHANFKCTLFYQGGGGAGNIIGEIVRTKAAIKGAIIGAIKAIKGGIIG